MLGEGNDLAHDCANTEEGFRRRVSGIDTQHPVAGLVADISHDFVPVFRFIRCDRCSCASLCAARANALDVRGETDTRRGVVGYPLRWQASNRCWLPPSGWIVKAVFP
jgi:hypothetical protein